MAIKALRQARWAQVLAACLATQRVLIVLDNVSAHTAAVVTPFLGPHQPGSLMLITASSPSASAGLAVAQPVHQLPAAALEGLLLGGVAPWALIGGAQVGMEALDHPEKSPERTRVRAMKILRGLRLSQEPMYLPFLLSVCGWFIGRLAGSSERQGRYFHQIMDTSTAAAASGQSREQTILSLLSDCHQQLTPTAQQILAATDELLVDCCSLEAGAGLLSSQLAEPCSIEQVKKEVCGTSGCSLHVAATGKAWAAHHHHQALAVRAAGGPAGMWPAGGQARAAVGRVVPRAHSRTAAAPGAGERG